MEGGGSGPVGGSGSVQILWTELHEDQSGEHTGEGYDSETGSPDVKIKARTGSKHRESNWIWS